MKGSGDFATRCIGPDLQAHDRVVPDVLGVSDPLCGGSECIFLVGNVGGSGSGLQLGAATPNIAHQIYYLNLLTLPGNS